VLHTVSTPAVRTLQPDAQLRELKCWREHRSIQRGTLQHEFRRAAVSTGLSKSLALAQTAHKKNGRLVSETPAL
jgi:hypothetical protein